MFTRSSLNQRSCQNDYVHIMFTLSYDEGCILGYIMSHDVCNLSEVEHFGNDLQPQLLQIGLELTTTIRDNLHHFQAPFRII